MDPTTVLLQLTVALAVITFSKYLIYIFTSPFYYLNKSKFLRPSVKLSPAEIEKAIKISVIIPSCNEEVGIINSVKSLLSSNYNNLEVIVVDDGSTDNTEQIIQDFIRGDLHMYKKDGKNFIFLKKKNGGKASALNYGIKNSTGNLIVTMDADTVFEKDALLTVARYFMNSELDAAVGNVKVANGNSLLGIIQQIEYTIGFYFKRTHSIFNSEYIIGGAFGIFRRKMFEKYGYFDELNKTEDIEFSTRLQRNGSMIAFIEDAIAFTEGPSTIRDLMKQRLRWKKGRLDTFYTHRSLFFSSDKKHSKFLTHFLLPITIFYEAELLIEPFLTIFGFFYLYTTHDFRSLIFWIFFTGLMNTVAFLFGSEKNSKKALTFLPIYFLLSYVVTFIEIYAMYASLRLILMKKDVKWQSWNRKGIFIDN